MVATLSVQNNISKSNRLAMVILAERSKNEHVGILQYVSWRLAFPCFLEVQNENPFWTFFFITSFASPSTDLSNRVQILFWRFATGQNRGLDCLYLAS
jgi:hypothetical protein